MDEDYPQYRRRLEGLIEQLRVSIPGTIKGFGLLEKESMKPGALSAKHKELMALGIGIASRCDGCIAFHTYEALAQGATAAEVTETIAVAIMMGGGPALVYAARAVEALEQFQNEGTV